MPNEVTIDPGAGLRLGAHVRTMPSLSEIARRSGKSRSLVSRVASGQRRPNREIVQACRDLGLPVEVIFGRDVLEQLERAGPKRS